MRIEPVNYDPDKLPLFIGLSVEPHVFVNEPPTGPNAGEFLQPPLQLPTLPLQGDGVPQNDAKLQGKAETK